jgi:hypothetical protein
MQRWLIAAHRYRDRSLEADLRAHLVNSSTTVWVDPVRLSPLNPVAWRPHPDEVPNLAELRSSAANHFEVGAIVALAEWNGRLIASEMKYVPPVKHYWTVADCTGGRFDPIARVQASYLLEWRGRLIACSSQGMFDLADRVWLSRPSHLMRMRAAIVWNDRLIVGLNTGVFDFTPGDEAELVDFGTTDALMVHDDRLLAGGENGIIDVAESSVTHVDPCETISMVVYRDRLISAGRYGVFDVTQHRFIAVQDNADDHESWVGEYEWTHLAVWADRLLGLGEQGLYDLSDGVELVVPDELLGGRILCLLPCGDELYLGSESGLAALRLPASGTGRVAAE